MSLLDTVEQLESANVEDEEDEYTDGEEDSSYTDDEEDGDDDEYESDSEAGDEEEEDEPVLKYKRFAKEVVNALHQGQEGETKNVIQCMAVHRKVTSKMLLCALIRIIGHSKSLLVMRVSLLMVCMMLAAVYSAGY